MQIIFPQLIEEIKKTVQKLKGKIYNICVTEEYKACI